MTEYEQLMASREALRRELESGGVSDVSEDPGDGVGQDAIASARGMNQPPVAAPDQASGKLQQAGQVTTAASGGNPYVAGAGLALQTVGAVDDAKRQSEQAKIDAYNKKIMAQRSAIRNFFA